MIDRRRDAADIFTVSIIKGVGVDAQAAFFTPALGLTSTTLGLEDGRIVNNTSNNFLNPFDVNTGTTVAGILLLSFKDNEQYAAVLEDRNKHYCSFFTLGFIPWIPPDGPRRRLTPHYFTKLEIAASCGVGLRLGFNPGELLDFLLGWATIDIFNDDLGARKSKEDSNKPPEAADSKSAEPAAPDTVMK